jgi:hypothetical protein
MSYQPKSSWYFLILALIIFADAALVRLDNPALQRSYVGWTIAGGVIALVGAALAWHRARAGKHPDRTT